MSQRLCVNIILCITPTSYESYNVIEKKKTLKYFKIFRLFKRLQIA